MRVLVTGSVGGFVGPWLSRHLSECGDEVIELPLEVDVRDAGALTARLTAAKPEVVYHLAALSSVRQSWDDPATTFAVNVLGTLNLCNAAARLPQPPRVLVISSSEVYGKVEPADLPAKESHPFAPVDPYAASKAAAELVGLQAWLGRGLEVIRVRPFNHTGPGQNENFVVPALASQVAAVASGEAKYITVGNLDVRRDLTDVRDVVRAYRLVMQRGVPGEVYNICRGESFLMSDVLRRLMEAACVEAPVVVDPHRFRPADVPDQVGDPGRLRELTGWLPRIPLSQTLADILQSQRRLRQA
ncbi:MAG TPA: GDP-mannose 4,6-dehydratase [Acidimicrobiales bacterium]|nr:GDP-mannose 4,6-dehydratase [Acidimicrobiales bacterium]